VVAPSPPPPPGAQRPSTPTSRALPRAIARLTPRPSCPPVPRPDDTPWEDGTFRLQLEFTEDYPNKAPTVKFVTKLFHPNVYADGSICLDILQNQVRACPALPYPYPAHALRALPPLSARALWRLNRRARTSSRALSARGWPWPGQAGVSRLRAVRGLHARLPSCARARHARRAMARGPESHAEAGALLSWPPVPWSALCASCALHCQPLPYACCALRPLSQPLVYPDCQGPSHVLEP
jgi:hypothetical protein